MNDNAKLEQLINMILSYNPGADIALLEKAHAFATERHAAQKKIRRSIYRSSESVAIMLAEMEMDLPTIIAECCMM